MKIQIVSWIIMLVVWVSYTFFCKWYVGKQESVSKTFYVLNEKKEGLGWLFWFMCMGIGLPLATFAEYNGLFFLGGVGLILLGTAAQFKKDFVEKYHYAGVLIGVLSSLVACIIMSWTWSFFIVLLTGLIIWESKADIKNIRAFEFTNFNSLSTKNKYYTWNIEEYSFYVIWIALGLGVWLW